MPLYSKVSGKLWLDAAYGRDFTAASLLKDSIRLPARAKTAINLQPGMAGYLLSRIKMTW